MEARDLKVNIGKKASNLFELINFGIPVPKTYVLNFDFYDRVWNELDEAYSINSMVESIQINRLAIFDLGQKVHDILMNCEFSNRLIEELRDVFTSLQTELPLIVRSAANHEDLYSSSFAGVYDSYSEIVDFNGFVQGVKKCYASLFSQRAILQRQWLNINHIDVKMSIIIQPFIKGKNSGVLFTKNPVNNLDEIIIEYSQISEKVTSGNGKSERIVFKGTDTTELPFNWVRKLIEYAKVIEQKYNCPQDIEFVVDSIGSIYIVQARPIVNSKSIKVETSYMRHWDSDDFDKVSNYKHLEFEQISTRWEAKKGPLRRSANKLDIPILKSFFLEFSVEWFNGKTYEEFWDMIPSTSKRFFIDVNESLRNQWHNRFETYNLLKNLAESSNDGVVLVRLREWFHHIRVYISAMVSKNEVMVEYVANAMAPTSKFFRGLIPASGRVIINIDNGTLSKDLIEETAWHPTDATLLRIARYTRELAKYWDGYSFDWEEDGENDLWLLDGTTSGGIGISNSFEVISRGSVSGKVVSVESSFELEELSFGLAVNKDSIQSDAHESSIVKKLNVEVQNGEQVIIVAKYPYTALATLTDIVDGFIFEEGSLLSHLSVILREKGKPAYFVKDAMNLFITGQTISLPDDLNFKKPVIELTSNN